MSRREDIDNAIWSDPDFEDLSPNATLLYLWSFTNPHCGMAGLYKVSLRTMTESKVSREDLPAALEELAATGFAFYEDHVLFVRTRVKHLRSRSPQMAQSVAKDVSKITPGHALRARFFAVYGDDPWLKEKLSETCKDPIGNLSQKPIGKGKSHRSTVPSPEGAGQGSGQGPGQGIGVSEQQLPSEFPEDLRPHLLAAHRILSGLAARHGAKEVKPLSLASLVMANPRKPLVRAAYECASYWDGQTTRLKDVVAAYRNWLGKADDLASTEPTIGSQPSNVRPLQRAEALQRADAWKAGYDNGGAA